MEKAVIQIDRDGKEIARYRSCADAARKNGLWRQAVWFCCEGAYKTSGGYRWKYEREGEVRKEKT